MKISVKTHLLLSILITIIILSPVHAANVYTTYLWHMHQPIYWPERSQANSNAYQFAFESLVLKNQGGNTYPGAQTNPHPENDLDQVFGKDDRVSDYQHYPTDTLSACSGFRNMGAQLSFAGALIQNINSLAQGNWQGGRYGTGWMNNFANGRSWTTSGGKPRLDIVNVAFHHPVCALLEESVLRKEIQIQKVIDGCTWGGSHSKGFFPAEMCFSERMIPALKAEGIDWCLVPNIHISRACPDYPFVGHEDNCDPPNKADQINPAGGNFNNLRISRGINCKNALPLGYIPSYAQYVDPDTGRVDKIIVVPAAMAMSWNEGYSPYGTGEIDAIASYGTSQRPLLILFAHDGDNAYSGGYSYFNENVPRFCGDASARGYEPSTVEQYLADHPVPSNAVVHVEDGGWVNADGDFGSPQYINWNWPLFDSQGNFDIEQGWAEDQRNWAVLTAAQNWVETAEQVAGNVRAEKIVEPDSTSSEADRAWHFFLGALDSGYMYYGQSIDMEVKATIGCNRALEHAKAVLAGSYQDLTAPSMFLPQRFPYNPGGTGAGALWGYQEKSMVSDFYVYTFIADVSGVAQVTLKIREDADGVNPLSDTANETYAGGVGVGSWQAFQMTKRPFPKDNYLNSPQIDFFVLPDEIADEYYYEVTGFSDVLLDYFVEATDTKGNVKRSPIQHVWVGQSNTPTQTGVWWEPARPYSQGTVTIYYGKPGQGCDLHWGVNGNAGTWQLPIQAYRPAGTTVWGGPGTAVDTPMLGPDSNGNYSVTLGPFDDPSQQVDSIDFVIHFADDSWDNNNGQDYRIDVRQGAPTETPTPRPQSPTPTATTLETATPTPLQTSTPTPTSEPLERLLIGGYWDTNLQVNADGRLNLIVIYEGVASPAELPLSYAGAPLGIGLKDDGLSGDFAAGDSVYGFDLVLTPNAAAWLVLEVDLPGVGTAWPYLAVR